MPYSLKGRRVLITGGSRQVLVISRNEPRADANSLATVCRGLGALIAERFAAEGCHVAINYVSNLERALETAAKVEDLESYEKKVVLVQGDVGVLADCERIVQESIDGLGGLDIIINNAGWTKFTSNVDLNALSEEEWDKCWAVNTKSNLHLLRKAAPTLNANPDGGVFLITSSIAGATTQGSSMAYSVSKAAGLHLMKWLAISQGPKIRVNAIIPGLLLTEWGYQFSPERIRRGKDRATLKKETDLDDCADAFVALAKNSSMTGQSVQIDSGLALGASLV